MVSDHRSTPSRSSISTTAESTLSFGTLTPSTNNIKVIARFRPHNESELKLMKGGNTTTSDSNDFTENNNIENSIEPLGSGTIVEFLSEESCNIETKDFNGSFTFDRVFDMSAKQEDVFNYSLKQTVDDLMKGYNGTVFAYGQTGSGKTFTMMGPNSNIDNPELKGVIPRIVDRIFQMILNSSADIEYTVKVSYMEIYMERIRDLLNPSNDNLPVHEDKTRGVYVKGLTEEYVSSADEVYQVMRQGSTVRAVASTSMNQESSRSHSIFVITVAQKNTVSGAQKTGQLSLVDLAGSEKVGKTGASGQTLEEAKKINKSLSALGMVINSLTDGKSTHVPYRDSKLTRILQESLGGNSRTSLIVNCSPSVLNDAETLSTLRFGVRAKNIKNKAKINTELSPLELRQLLKKCQHQLEGTVSYSNKLETEITAWRSGDPPPKESWIPLIGAQNILNSPLPPNSKSRHSSSVSTSSVSTFSGPQSPPNSFFSSPAFQHSRSASAVSTNSNSRPTTPGPYYRKSTLLNNPKRNSVSEGFLSPSGGSNIPTPTKAAKSGTSTPVPTASGQNSNDLDVDTIEEYLKRENQLQDQISEKENLISEQEQLLLSLRSQIQQLQKTSDFKKENNDLKLQLDNLSYEKKELSITNDSLKEENKRLMQDLQNAKQQLISIEIDNSSIHNGLKTKLSSHVSSSSIKTRLNSNGDKELPEDDPTVTSYLEGTNVENSINSEHPENEGDKSKNDSAPEAKTENGLSPEALYDQKKRKKMSEILGEYYQPDVGIVDVAVKDGEPSYPRDLKPDSKEFYKYIESLIDKQNAKFQEYIQNVLKETESEDAKLKLEKIYESKLKASEETSRELLAEIGKLKYEALHPSISKDTSLNTVSSQDSSDKENKNKETTKDVDIKEVEKQAAAVATAAAQEKISKMQSHIAQYEQLKANLMRDLQERCERVVELEISLDQAKEQYNLAMKQSNNNQQEKKMALLQRNLEQLTNIQRQLVEQNTVLKRDVTMAHKILLARNDRIQSLESALRESQNRLGQESEIFETKLTYLRDRLLEVKKGVSLSGPSFGATSPTLAPSLGSPTRDRPTFSSLSANYLLSNNQSDGNNPTSPLGSPTFKNSSSFPTVPSYGPNNKVIHYPDLSPANPSSVDSSSSLHSNIKIVKPLRGGGGSNPSTTNTNNTVTTPIKQRTEAIAKGASGLWTKLNSFVNNSAVAGNSNSPKNGFTSSNGIISEPTGYKE